MKNEEFPCGLPRTRKTIDKIIRMLSAAFFILHSSFFIACSDEMIEQDEDTVDALEVSAGGRVRITADDIITTTRTTISGKTTTFDDGDIVGCVICTKDDDGNYVYKATGKWKYDSSYRTFLISRYWTASSDDTPTLTAYEPIESDITNFFISYETESSDVASSSDASDVGGGYTLISSDAGTLYLFFYRPYIDPLENTTDRPFLTAWPQVTEDETTTYLMGFAGPQDDCTFSTTVYKAVDGSYSSSTETLDDKVKCFSWEQYPVFINLDQGISSTTDDDGTTSTTTYGLEVSDGLSAQYTGGVSSASTEVLRLTFSKQVATIRLLATSTISEAYLINGQTSTEVTQDYETYYVYSEAPITAGNLVSIKSASDVGWSDTHSLYKYRNIQSTDEITGAIYTPSFDYDFPSGTVNITSAARFHLPPQTDFHGMLKYKLSDDNVYSYLALDSLGSGTLEPGTRYTANLFNIEDQYLYCSGSKAYTTNGSYLTLGCEDSGYTASNNIGSISTSYSINGTTISYRYNMANTGGYYLGVFVPTTMTLTMYFVSQTTTPSVVVFETNSSYVGTTLYDTPTLVEATDDSGKTILKATVQLEEGYYRIRRSSGTCYFLYALLTM